MKTNLSFGLSINLFYHMGKKTDVEVVVELWIKCNISMDDEWLIIKANIVLIKKIFVSTFIYLLYCYIQNKIKYSINFQDALINLYFKLFSLIFATWQRLRAFHEYLCSHFQHLNYLLFSFSIHLWKLLLL